MSISRITAFKADEDGKHWVRCELNDPSAELFRVHSPGYWSGSGTEFSNLHDAESFCYKIAEAFEAGRQDKAKELRAALYCKERT